MALALAVLALGYALPSRPTPLANVAARGSRARNARLAASSEYIIQLDQDPPRAAVLLLTWTRTAQNMRAAGFQPESEAIGDRANKLKELTSQLPVLGSEARVLAMLKKGDGGGSPEGSADAERLQRTRVAAAISAGAGSAISFVSRWDDHWSVDSIVVNPSYMVAGEAAERVLLAAVTEAAAAAGVARVKLRSPYQVGGGREFYAQCGFAPCPDCTPGGGGESCEWLQHDCAA